jgi:serine/threonine protein phosphatase PrpC
MNCPKCGAEARPGARFCEIDGAQLVLDNVVDRTGFGVCRCGAGPDAIDESGYCTECGIKRDVRLRDHVEIEPAGEFAGVTDRGLRHSENQDDMALAVPQTAQGPCYVAVVCDGVSGSEGAASASSAAAKTAVAALERGLLLPLVSKERDGVWLGLRDPLEAGAVERLMASTIAEANDAVCQLTYSHGGAKDPPETTIVAAVVVGRTAVIGWVGDSRAYWFTDTDAAMVTRDHSWVNDVVDAGQMTEEEALHSPMAHAIVRCLGGAAANSDERVEPSIVRCELPVGARLLLCTDGLWNYASGIAELSDLVHQVSGESPRATARRLVQYALGQGGKDNITAVVLDAPK